MLFRTVLQKFEVLAYGMLVFLLSVGLSLIPMETVKAGHSRSGYLDAGQSANGRFLVTAKRIDTLDKKGRRIDHRWDFTWLDRKTKETHEGELKGLRSGSDDVFDPVNAHLFVAPDGETFALWIPQAMARSEQKKPSTDERQDVKFRTFAGFAYRLTIYKKTGERLKKFDVKDFLSDQDWNWFYFYGRQVYWLKEYDKLTTRSTPRSGYALYRISPDYTLLEFQIGATQEAAYKAKQRGVIVPVPRKVFVRLTDGVILSKEEFQQLPSAQQPVQPFVGDLANKDQPQYGYVPSLQPVQTPGTFISRDRNQKPIRLGHSSPSVKPIK